MPPPVFQLMFQWLWLSTLLIILGLAAFWRFAARHRIAADPSLRQPLNRLYGGFAFWLSLPALVMGAGVLSGSVLTTLHFMLFDLSNPFVAAFYGLAVVEDALLIWWVFFRDGDRLLALHSELPVNGPRFRLGVRALVIFVLLSHASFVFFYATFFPHLGQLLGA